MENGIETPEIDPKPYDALDSGEAVGIARRDGLVEILNVQIVNDTLEPRRLIPEDIGYTFD